MSNTQENRINVHAWIGPLEEIDQLARNERQHPDSGNREKLNQFFKALRQELPQELYETALGQITRAKQVITVVENQHCGACRLTVPRGDYIPVLAGKSVVTCHYCGAILYATDSERLSAGMAPRPKASD